jgi:uncharacterized repeat protein (TIGR01451 family)
VSATLAAAFAVGQVAPFAASADPPGRAHALDAHGAAHGLEDRECGHGACRPADDPIEPSAAVPAPADDAAGSADAGSAEGSDPATPADLRVTKTSDAPPLLYHGDTFTYTITVTNAGGGDATGVRVLDELPPGDDLAVAISPFPTFAGEPCAIASSLPPGGIAHTTVTCGPAALAAGTSAALAIRVVVTGSACGAITNDVTVQASNEPAQLTGDDHDSVTDEVACPPRLHVSIDGPARAHVGDTVRYRVDVRNTGGTELTAVGLSAPACDAPASLVGNGDGDAVLAEGERWTFACRRTIPDGEDPIVDRATAEAVHDGRSVTAADTHRIDVLHPGIALEATASPDAGSPGSGIVVTYRITNTGDTALHGIEIADALLGHVGRVETLETGASIERSATLTLGEAPFTTVARASGHDALGAVVRAADPLAVGVVAGAGGAGTPFTGAAVGTLAVLSLAAGAAGLALLVATRRRRPAGTA